jgi:hypothetical protein
MDSLFKSPRFRLKISGPKQSVRNSIFRDKDRLIPFFGAKIGIRESHTLVDSMVHIDAKKLQKACDTRAGWVGFTPKRIFIR